jgi:hypothetical protein
MLLSRRLRPRAGAHRLNACRAISAVCLQKLDPVSSPLPTIQSSTPVSANDIVHNLRTDIRSGDRN